MPKTKAEKYWELYQQGISCGGVARAFGVSRQYVWDTLKKGGYDLRRKVRLPFIEYQGKRYSLTDSGYYRDASQAKGVFLHRLVWTQHHGVIPTGHYIAHINGDKSDNRIENLECRERNVARNRKKVKRLDTGEVYESMCDAARKTGVNRSSIWQAIRRNGKSLGTEWEYVE